MNLTRAVLFAVALLALPAVAHAQYDEGSEAYYDDGGYTGDPAVQDSQTPEPQAPPPAAIYNSAPFTGGTHFTSMICNNVFACDNYVGTEEYIAMADGCAASRLGYPAGIMRYFETTGVYANCVLPDNYAPKSDRLGANAQWPICCVQQSGDQCFFICHSYISSGG